MESSVIVKDRYENFAADLHIPWYITMSLFPPFKFYGSY